MSITPGGMRTSGWLQAVHAPLTLPRLLERYPWAKRWTDLGEPMDYLWKFELDVPVRKIWPWLADTSTFNRMLGLPAMKFEEKNGRLFGSSGSGVLRLEWEEARWEWEYGRGLNSARIYSEGFAHYVRARYLLQDLGRGRLRLFVYFGWIPRTTLGRRVLLPLSMRWLEKRYVQAIGRIVAAIRADEAPPAPPPRAQLAPDAEARLRTIQADLRARGIDPGLCDRLIEFVRAADDDDLHRIRIRPIARRWKVPEEDLLLAFLHATRAGLFTLSWDVLCPHCRGVRRETLRLGEIPRRGTCEVCEIDFDATGINSLEVTFHVHPSLRSVEKKMYCAAEPATKAHILIQQDVAPGEEVILETILEPGRYRLRMLGSREYGILDVAESTPPKPILWKADQREPQWQTGPGPVIQLLVESGPSRCFIVEENRIDRDALRPADLFRFQVFRDLFSEEAVAADVQLDVGVQAILFTDIVGSTRYYELAGDSVAFARVWDHFRQAYEIVKARRGALIKTSGDAVLAAFLHPSDGLAAAVDLQTHFREGATASGLRLRASLHVGPCLAVRLDSNIDYFGNTVNLAAKIQTMADAGQIAFTEAVHGDGGVQELLRERGLTAEAVPFHLKWSGETIRAYRIEIR